MDHALHMLAVPAADVDAQIALAVAAGATIISPIRDGGLYSSYFADPQGNGWEMYGAR